ncbi:MAG: hypothetical protein V3V93_04895 [bacterium]
MIKKLIAMTVVLSMLAVPTVALAQIDIVPSLKKLELGIKNLTISGMSLEEGVGERLAEQPRPFMDSLVEGLIKGIFMLPGRFFVGIFQILTFPFGWLSSPVDGIDLSKSQ